MLASLNDAADNAAREAAARVAADMHALLNGDLRSAQPAQIERDGRARLGELAVGAAEAWRQEQARRLEEGLARLDERLTADLRAELDALRDAAADLLGLALSVPSPGDRLAPDLRFFYLLAEEKPAKLNCWLGRFGATSPVKQGSAAPESTCAARPPI